MAHEDINTMVFADCRTLSDEFSLHANYVQSTPAVVDNELAKSLLLPPYDDELEKALVPLDLPVPVVQENEDMTEVEPTVGHQPQPAAFNPGLADEAKLSDEDIIKWVKVVLTPEAGPPRKRRSKSTLDRPLWLPADWKYEARVRRSGRSAGQIDKYFTSPRGNRGRSKKDVKEIMWAELKNYVARMMNTLYS